MTKIPADADLDRSFSERPWGGYECIARGTNYQVKRITVLPGQSISLQKHLHRAEHWVVVQGVAKTECDGDVRHLNPNDNVYIPLGAVHRLTNPGTEVTEIIEVQYGDQISEEDIIRLQDNYGRV
ncbi:MAG: phosphomannose isomerase type II C-terminal cupin domain, partial [Alphaproteobacteria bacterium]|nr:phosphomannose isomerase type II C-terminal cupin domain [Alphaproteobacteria bacterium]MBV8549601.1 phosphomannose isomerase type II C-terminal cupin domain [Alphaproteobacteria bacterium]